MRIVTSPLLGIARTWQVGVVAEKLPKQQVKHLMKYNASPQMSRHPPKRWAQEDGISRQRECCAGCMARAYRGICGRGSTIGDARSHNGTPKVRYPGSKSLRCGAEAIGNKIRGQPVVCPRHGPQRVSEVGSEAAQGVVIARFQPAGSILGQPDRASNSAANNGPALCRRVRGATSRTLEPEGYGSWLHSCDRLSKRGSIALLRAV
jgi:hypothetical protein